MMVRQRHIGRRGHFLHQRVVRVVFAPLVLVAYHGHLGLPIRLVQPQMAHAIGLDGDVAREIIAPHRREIVGAIDRG